MAKIGKGTAVDQLARFGYMVAMKICTDKGVELNVPEGITREISFDAFMEYCENSEEMKNIPKMLARFVTFDGEHEYEKAARKAEEKRELKKKMAEAMAADLGI